ncbi:MAG: NUDIX domain-containing protein [Nitrospiraceae bacterium]|nr:NUDIX domain-containing protein [Nitrospiraceae bacterium]
MAEELLEIVNERGDVLGIALRSEIHGNPSLIHRVVHVLVFNSKGELLLQKRSMDKDVAAGKWDTSVGGHVDPGEAPELAARREMLEELGVEADIRFLYSYIHSNPYETELVNTYHALCSDGFRFNAEEIDELRFWSIGDIKTALGNGMLSDNFEHEIKTYLLESGGKTVY